MKYQVGDLVRHLGVYNKQGEDANVKGIVLKAEKHQMYIHWLDRDDSSWYTMDNLYIQKDRKSTRLNSSHVKRSRMPSSA